MKYYKFHQSTYFKKIINTLTSEQINKVYSGGYPTNGPIFVPCDYISYKLYKECKEYEDNLNPYK